jgi:hypothetical protein
VATRYRRFLPCRPRAMTKRRAAAPEMALVKGSSASRASVRLG